MKYFGKIGFTITKETVPGVWVPEIIEKDYYGDILKFGNRRSSSDKLNEDTEITNTISIMADPFAYENFQNMAYVEWMGSKWKISTIDIDRPRIEIHLGGLYNATE